MTDPTPDPVSVDGDCTVWTKSTGPTVMPAVPTFILPANTPVEPDGEEAETSE